MNRGQTVFAQLLRFISHNDFNRFVDRYDGNWRARSLSCWEQFLAMAFAQLNRVKPESYGALKEIRNESVDIKVQTVGHTDSDGDAAQNLDLSKFGSKDHMAGDLFLYAELLEGRSVEWVEVEYHSGEIPEMVFR